MARLASVVVGFGGGVAAGAGAEASSDIYGQKGRGAMRATAHSGLPFLVAAVVSTERFGRPSATPWRAGFLGVHVVHVRQIVRLVRSGGARDPQVRAALGLGSPNYVLLLAQTALLNEPVESWAGPRRAARWVDAIDGQLLRAYAIASLAGLLRHRRPLGVYALVAALLAIGFGARRN